MPENNEKTPPLPEPQGQKNIGKIKKFPEYRNLVDSVLLWEYGSKHTIEEIEEILGISYTNNKKEFKHQVRLANQNIIKFGKRIERVPYTKAGLELSYVVINPADFTRRILMYVKGSYGSIRKALQYSEFAPIEKMTPDQKERHMKIADHVRRAFAMQIETTTKCFNIMGLTPKLVLSELRPVKQITRKEETKIPDGCTKYLCSNNDNTTWPCIGDRIKFLSGDFKERNGTIVAYTEKDGGVICHIEGKAGDYIVKDYETFALVERADKIKATDEDSKKLAEKLTGEITAQIKQPDKIDINEIPISQDLEIACTTKDPEVERGFIVCVDCHQKKPIDDFKRYRAGSESRCHRCKDCEKEKKKEYDKNKTSAKTENDTKPVEPIKTQTSLFHVDDTVKHKERGASPFTGSGIIHKINYATKEYLVYFDNGMEWISENNLVITESEKT